MKLARVTALVPVRSSTGDDSRTSGAEDNKEEGSVEIGEAGRLRSLGTVGIGCGAGPPDRLEGQFRQTGTHWYLEEEVVRLPKVFVLFQPRRFHRFLRDPNGFEVVHRRS